MTSKHPYIKTSATPPYIYIYWRWRTFAVFAPSPWRSLGGTILNLNLKTSATHLADVWRSIVKNLRQGVKKNEGLGGTASVFLRVYLLLIIFTINFSCFTLPGKNSFSFIMGVSASDDTAIFYHFFNCPFRRALADTFALSNVKEVLAGD